VDAIIAEVVGIIALVTLLSALLGAVARRLGQPTVIGQILTGVLLGPSVLGHIPGHLEDHLVPHQALPSVTVLGQVAVVVFMFGVGYEVETAALQRHGRAVPLVAIAAVTVPMGLCVACLVLDRSAFTAVGGHPGRLSFVLFMAVAASITALPVLAAIVRERGLAGTPAGVVATAAAGIMDLLAWLVLAAALLGVGHHSSSLPWPAVLALICVFSAAMLFGVRPALSWWWNRRQSVLSSTVTVAFVLAMGSAWVTASLGLHPIFGAFLGGLTMRGVRRPPDADVLRAVDEAAGLMLPLFFISTGLSLDVGGVGTSGLVLLALLLAVACVGKLGPAYAVSRWCGLEPRQSAAIAALVNTRGLTELIALNVGLTNGIINQRLFTILVLIAFITTLMTGPLLSWIRPAKADREASAELYPASATS
jgi:Kef-type K+ transport system membrane component KefB